ncbi:MAG: hypothetical protein EOO24_08840 [Comamonadaceae bacterium]|nr:MAG: hypothetical protein EOO24_08840 [Comamonadaceae bacterium]
MSADTDTDAGFAEHIPHAEFSEGLPRGRFRVIVDPKLARGYVRQRLMLLPVVVAMIGVGIALTFSGSTAWGVALVALGVGLNRLVAWNAGKILLHLALRNPAVYHAAAEGGVMEVRRA